MKSGLLLIPTRASPYRWISRISRRYNIQAGWRRGHPEGEGWPAGTTVTGIVTAVLGLFSEIELLPGNQPAKISIYYVAGEFDLITVRNSRYPPGNRDSDESKGYYSRYFPNAQQVRQLAKPGGLTNSPNRIFW